MWSFGSFGAVQGEFWSVKYIETKPWPKKTPSKQSLKYRYKTIETRQNIKPNEINYWTVYNYFNFRLSNEMKIVKMIKEKYSEIGTEARPVYNESGNILIKIINWTCDGLTESL